LIQYQVIVADADSAFVLLITIYTGKSTYNEKELEDTKKTVLVVKNLCIDFKDSHCVVFVDRFYMSIDLLKGMGDIGLYVTGTCMRNRLPKEVIHPKKSSEYKEMERGDFKINIYKYKGFQQKREEIWIALLKGSRYGLLSH
jgi:Transposase IS4